MKRSFRWSTSPIAAVPLLLARDASSAGHSGKRPGGGRGSVGLNQPAWLAATCTLPAAPGSGCDAAL
jgi:hypothetical protein